MYYTCSISYYVKTSKLKKVKNQKLSIAQGHWCLQRCVYFPPSKPWKQTTPVKRTIRGLKTSTTANLFRTLRTCVSWPHQPQTHKDHHVRKKETETRRRWRRYDLGWEGGGGVLLSKNWPTFTLKHSEKFSKPFIGVAMLCLDVFVLYHDSKLTISNSPLPLINGVKCPIPTSTPNEKSSPPRKKY